MCFFGIEGTPLLFQGISLSGLTLEILLERRQEKDHSPEVCIDSLHVGGPLEYQGLLASARNQILLASFGSLALSGVPLAGSITFLAQSRADVLRGNIGSRFQ